MPPHKVHVMKAIWSDEDRTDLFDHLYRDIELPFVAFVGLAIGQEDWYCGPIERIKWDGERQIFVADSQDDTENADRTAAEIRDYDMKYANWLSYKKQSP